MTRPPSVEEAAEIMRRLLMDHADTLVCDPWKEPCGCSIAQARRFMERVEHLSRSAEPVAP